MKLLTQEGGAGAMLAEKVSSRAVALAWLGQAGFALKYRDQTLLVDPYLSDLLAEKYQGARFDHVRMMPAPIRPADLRGLAAVLCSHGHGDHMDPATLPVVARNNFNCRFVVPRPEKESALELGLPETRTVPVDADDVVLLSRDVWVRAVPAAHETLKLSPCGHHYYLGFLLKLGPFRIYHSGDCVPFPGLAERLRARRIDLALLPVNGRDAFRREHGILGNMTFDEARKLCLAAGIPRLVPHHFGMFEFNTVDPESLRRQADRCAAELQCTVPQIDRHYLLG